MADGRAYKTRSQDGARGGHEYGFRCRLCGHRTVIAEEELTEKQEAALHALGRLHVRRPQRSTGRAGAR